MLLHFQGHVELQSTTKVSQTLIFVNETFYIFADIGEELVSADVKILTVSHYLSQVAAKLNVSS